VTHEFSPHGGGIAQRDDFGNFEANLRFLAAAGEPARGERVLEIGPGKGRLLRRFRDAGAAAVGVELNPEMIAAGRRLHGALPVARGHAEDLPFGDGTFDAVVCFDVFEHVPDSDRFLRETRRVLRPGGRVLLQTPNKWLNVIFETFRYRSFTAWRADHCALHSYRQLRRRLRRNGFEPEFLPIPVVNEWYRRKVRAVLGPPGVLALRLAQVDRWPLILRTNFYVHARRTDGAAVTPDL